MAEADGFDVRSLAVTYRNGVNLGLHRHRWGQLIYASSGVMRVATDAQAWIVPPTRAIWIPAELAHAITGRDGLSLRTLYIAPARAKGLPDNATVLEVAPMLRELILHVLAIGMLAPGQPSHDRLAGVLVDLLQQANRIDLVLPLPNDRRALDVANRIMSDPGCRCDLATLSAEAGASLRTMQRLFPDQTGLTLDGWRQKCRLVEAVAQLAAGTQVTVVALNCGYDSLAAFIAAFSRTFGTTPGRFARMTRE